jgi:hypothetical protein
LVVRTFTGTADRSTALTAKWNLTDTAGTPVQPGVYTLTLTGATTAGATALPFTSTVTVTPPVSLTVPTRAALQRSIVPAGTGRAGKTVSVSVSSGGLVTDFGEQTVGSDGTWRLSSSPVTAGHDLTWSVTDPLTGYVAHRTTKVTPSVLSPTSPALVRSGQAQTVSGTALPDGADTVTLMTQPTGASSATPGAVVPVNADGTWQTSFVPTAPTTVWVRDSRKLNSNSALVYPVGAASANAPSSAYAGRTVRVRGNAGNAPAQVNVQSRIGRASYTTVATTTAATDGAFHVRMPIPDDAGSTLAWRVTTGFGSAATGTLSILPTFPPTASGPKSAHWNSTHTLTGVAVPGDLVTIWTRPVGSSTWVQAGSTRAASSQEWSFPLAFTRDIEWRVTSPSGTSATNRTVISPTIHAPSAVRAGSLAVVHGTAVPGSSLTLYRSAPGSTVWLVVKTVTVASNGSWSISRHPRHAIRFRATSGGHTSRTITVSTT